MRRISIIVLIVLAGLFAGLTVCKPAALGENDFLQSFIGNDFISILIVIVTVSFVSVTQIHLEYSRIERTFGLRVFRDARREVNLGAFLLVLFLFVSMPLVIVKADLRESITAQSFFNSAALLVLAASIFIMYDFVRTVYVIAAEEPIEGEDDEEAEDDSKGGPKAGKT